MRILLIEDEPSISNFVARGLKEEGFAVDVANDGENGLYLSQINSYDIIILDVMLPVKNGIAVCKELRTGKNNALILMLTGKSTAKDKILGLNSGADDYLAKPFVFEELLARIRALIRRRNSGQSTTLTVDDLVLDQLTHRVIRAGKEIELTSKEFALLQYLMLNANQVVTRTMISEHVWNESVDTFTNVIDVYIKYLRQKIDDGFKKPLIHTLRGTGYIFKGRSV